MKFAAAGIALFVTVHLSPANATDLGPDVLVKGAYARITMFMGDRLRANNALAAHCRQETRDWAKAIEAGEQAKSSVPPDNVPRFGRRYDISEIVGHRYVSVIRRSYIDINGTDDVGQTDTFLWDSYASKISSPAGLFDETEDNGPAMARLLREVTLGINEQIGQARAADLIGGLRPSLDGIGPFSLAPSTVQTKSSGLNFHYAVPVPGRFGLQEIVVFVSWTKFQNDLSLYGHTIFGGNWRERHIW